jgi:hypothetical protein
MQSAFNAPRRRPRATSKPQIDEKYDFGGLNMIAPDQVMPNDETPFAINDRRYARNDGETRVARRTRRGSKVLSVPVGETTDASNAAANVADISFTTDKWVAFSYQAGANGALTKLKTRIKKATGTGGHVRIEIYTNNGGFPGLLVGETSILSSDVTTSYADVAAAIMDAPDQVSGDTYWLLYKVQDLGIGTYYLSQTAGSGILTTTDGGKTYTAVAGKIKFSTSVSTKGTIKGFTKRYPSNKANRTMFALGTGVYAVPDNPATPTLLDSNIHPDSLAVRFAHVDDLTVWTDSHNNLRQWDGTTVSDVPGAPTAPSNVIIYENRMMVIPSDDPTAVRFSALYDFKTWPSVNFFYVPRPKSPDPITAWGELQDYLLIFTHETKHKVYGSSISTFTRKTASGTKGCVSQEALAIDINNAYFMADDKQIYAYGGVDDVLLSEKVETELQQCDPNTVRLHLYRNQLRVYYRKAASPATQYMLMYDIQNRQWFRDTGRQVLGSIEWTLNDNELVEFSSRAGWMFFGEQGYSDAGKPIDFKLHTAYKAYGSGAAKDRIKKFRPIVRPSAQPYDLMVGRDIDFQDTPKMNKFRVDSGGAVWGSFKWGDGTIYGGKKVVDNATPMTGRGKFTQYRFEHKAVEQPVEIYGYISLIKSGRVK